ncbi:MAG: dihydroneopterin aldolase [Pseudomonadota bacterium]
MTKPVKTASSDVASLPRPDNAPRRVVFVSDLVLDAFIGVYDSEQGAAQPVRIDIAVDVVEPCNPAADRLEDVLCYNRLTQGVKAIIAEGHIKLVETLAERIASLALSHPMALSVRVRIEKPNAIAEAGAAGVEIMREKS